MLTCKEDNQGIERPGFTVEAAYRNGKLTLSQRTPHRSLMTLRRVPHQHAKGRTESQKKTRNVNGKRCLAKKVERGTNSSSSAKQKKLTFSGLLTCRSNCRILNANLAAASVLNIVTELHTNLLDSSFLTSTSLYPPLASTPHLGVLNHSGVLLTASGLPASDSA